MMKGMGKEITTGLVFLVGVVTAVMAASEAHPLVASIGAAASLTAGLYEAAIAASRSKAAREHRENQASKSSTIHA